MQNTGFLIGLSIDVIIELVKSDQTGFVVFYFILEILLIKKYESIVFKTPIVELIAYPCLFFLVCFNCFKDPERNKHAGVRELFASLKGP